MKAGWLVGPWPDGPESPLENEGNCVCKNNRYNVPAIA